MWQWWNYDRDQIPMGKAPLRINLDETAICLFQGDVKGAVFASKKRQRDEPFQRVGRRKRRCYLTHVAMICDRSDLQPLLPQTIIGNEHTFAAKSMAALRASCPGNVTIVRQKSAWNNEVLCAAIVRRLARALEPHAATTQPILFLDAVRLHTTRRVLDACAAAGIWAIVVPAKMTLFLQPLDTDAFLPFKLRLKELYQSARSGSVDGDLGVEPFLQCVYGAIRGVLQGRRWATAFEKAGFGDRQAGVAKHVLRQLQVDEPPIVPSTRPAADQVRSCFPRRSKVHAAALWRPFDGASVAAASVVGAAAGSDAVALARGPRTRGDHARAALARRVAPAVRAAPSGAVAPASLLHAALARGRPLPPVPLPRGRPLFLRGRGRGGGR